MSSAAPLKHKDKLSRQLISKERRMKFEALDLDTLLSEFRAVAASKEDGDDDTEVTEGDIGDGADTPSADATTVDALRWLRTSGLGQLADMHEEGRRITETDVEKLTEGYLPDQIQSINRRISLLNRVLRGASANGDEPEMLSPTSKNAESSARVTALSEQESGEPKIQFQDLGAEDQRQVQRLALISLTGILESSGSALKLGKPVKKKKKKKSESNLFGVNLSTLLEVDLEERSARMDNERIPVFLQQILKFLRAHGLGEEGIFRKAGGAARIKDLRKVCEDSKGFVEFEKLKARPHDVAALLKQFLRDTPEPLLTNQYLDIFSLTQQLQDKQTQIKALGLVSLLLPIVHQDCLKELLSFLDEVAKHEEVNKMGISNLAVVFAPTLFFVRGQKGQKMLKEVEMQVTTANALKMLIEYQKELWGVPPEIIGQLRYIYEQKRDGRKVASKKDVRKILAGRESVDSPYVPRSSNSPHVKWITDSKATPPVLANVVFQLPHNSTKSLDITTRTTVADVLKECLCPGHQLRERGGNIGERIVHAQSKIIPLIKMNPEGALVIVNAASKRGVLI